MNYQALGSTLAKLWEQAKNNLGFLGVCLAVFAGLFLLALLFERVIFKQRRALSDTHYISYLAIFSAMAGVLMLFEIPLFFAPSFYKIDLSELPVLICTFYLGPVAGVLSEMLKVLLKLLLKGTSTAFVGDFANFAVGCSFVLPASIVYHAKASKKTALIGLALGTLCMTVFGSAFNALYLIPKYAEMFMPLEAIIGMGTKVNAAITDVWTMVLYAVVPFNLVKGALVSLLTYLLYKRISPLLHRSDEKKQQRRKSHPTGEA